MNDADSNAPDPAPRSTSDDALDPPTTVEGRLRALRFASHPSLVASATAGLLDHIARLNDAFLWTFDASAERE